MVDKPFRVLLVSGSLRSGSTNTAVLKTAAAVAPDSIRSTLYRGMVQLPHFNPDGDRDGEPVHAAVAGLRAEVGRADALLTCTPEYAGALPGALNNLLEWTVPDCRCSSRARPAPPTASFPLAPDG